MIRIFNQTVRLRFIVLFVSILILAVFLPEADQTMRKTTESQVPQTDYFMDQFQMVETDANGDAIRSLAAATMVHFPDDTIHLTLPIYRLIHSERAGKQWEIRSEFGVLTGKTDVLLTGNVVIDRLLLPGNGDETTLLQVNSHDLHIDLTRNRGETDNPVSVKNDSGTVSAVGMRVNFDEQQLQLLSQVKGHYEVR